jgi:hypothetical protein
MRPVVPILILVSLPACSTRSTAPARLAPVPPPLPAALRAPCPPLAPIADSSIAALALGDIDAALAHADCAARHAGAVAAYEAARAAALRWNGESSADAP